jgi:hypothetical protein
MKKPFCLALAVFCYVTSAAFAQDAAAEPAAVEPMESAALVPSELRRPSGGESPRYPQDVVLGALGPGDAAPEAFAAAMDALGTLLSDSAAKPGRLGEAGSAALQEALTAISPRKYRIGGGKAEADGSASFLFRFMGSTQYAPGEIYMVQEGETWVVDDIFIDPPEDNAQKTDISERVNYMRFY